MPEAAEFDALRAEFYQGWFHYHPERAVLAGVPVTGRLLLEDDDDLAALRAWLEELLLGLDELEFAALDADRQLDWELMAGAARVEHRELAHRDRCRRDPLHCLPSAALARLTRAPTAALLGTLARLLDEIPEHLRQSQARLRFLAADLAPPLVRVAARESQHWCESLRVLARGSWLHRYGQGHPDLGVALESAALALAGYAHCLTDELAPRAQGLLGCGAEHLDLRLREVHFLDCGVLDCGPDGGPADGDGPLFRALERAEQVCAEGEGGAQFPPETGSLPLTVGPVPLPDWDERARFGAADPERARRLPRLLANPVSLVVACDLCRGCAQDAPGADDDASRRGPAARRARLLLARLDLDLHMGRSDGDAALERLHRAGLAGAAADALLAQLARHPGDALAGVLGWRLLEQARDAAGAALGTASACRDRLLSQGAIPLPLALRYGVGRAAWQAACAGVLGAGVAGLSVRP